MDKTDNCKHYVLKESTMGEGKVCQKDWLIHPESGWGCNGKECINYEDGD